MKVRDNDEDSLFVLGRGLCLHYIKKSKRFGALAYGLVSRWIPRLGNSEDLLDEETELIWMNRFAEMCRKPAMTVVANCLGGEMGVMRLHVSPTVVAVCGAMTVVRDFVPGIHEHLDETILNFKKRANATLDILLVSGSTRLNPLTPVLAMTFPWMNVRRKSL